MGKLDEIRKVATDAAEPFAFPLRSDKVTALGRDALALLAVVEALPTCDAEPPRGSQDAEGKTINLATKRQPFGGIYCDEHQPHWCVDLPYAAALRALLAGGG